MPDPVPTSKKRCPALRRPEAKSSVIASRHSTVVLWCPVPNADFGSMMMGLRPSSGVDSNSHGGSTMNCPARTGVKNSRHATVQS